ncbi:mercuric resistance operon regulatory protein [Mariprofundus micogutta]|uniref:Mercuric resistance operon regulatory protein n=1 Tax=Mariprofundus micogutta TaxID=1921010 RepID=A0A1L8CP04_9PROT|nr:MerR family transcriptional regulator [Mariprofundus micogutta]GAV20628.1 mercuric resistance operon regulatory protein [Mariprofundus micogutta]
MLTVGDLAKRCNVTSETVRYYARKGLLQPTQCSAIGYKLFGTSDIQRLRFIRRAKLLGFSLAEIGQIIQHSTKGESPCPLVRSYIQQKVKDNRQKLEEMSALQQRMESAIAQWEAMQDGIPDGHSICNLIEKFADEA